METKTIKTQLSPSTISLTHALNRQLQFGDRLSYEQVAAALAEAEIDLP